MRLIIARWLIVGTAAIVSFAQVAVQTETARRAKVALRVTDSYGEVLQPEWIRLISHSTKVDHGNLFKELIADGVPFGRYTLQVLKRGYDHAERIIDLDRPEHWLQVGLYPYYFIEPHPPDPPVLGKVDSGKRVSGPVWVSLVGQFTGKVFQALAAKGGSFQIPDVPVGQYVLCVYTGSELLRMSSVRLGPRRTPIDVVIE